MKDRKNFLLLIFIIMSIVLIISTSILVLSKKQKSKTENDKIVNSINNKIRIDIVGNIDNAVKAVVANNKVQQKDDIEQLRVISIDNKKIRLENGYIIYLNNKKLKFTNARTKKKYSISDIKVKDWIQLYKMKYIEKDKDVLILDSEKAEVIRNLKGKKLLDEILYTYTLDIQFLNGEMKSLKKLKNEEYLVTFIIYDYYANITKNKEKFKKAFKIRKDTLLVTLYKTRYENIIHAKDNMINMVLDKNTLNQKYPECKVFTFYDG